MVQSDVPAVVAIEASTFSTPWNEETFRSLLERSGVEVWVAEWEEEEEEETVAAYAILWCVLEEGNWPISRSAGTLGEGDRIETLESGCRSSGGRRCARPLPSRSVNPTEGARRMYAQNGFPRDRCSQRVLRPAP